MIIPNRGLGGAQRAFHDHGVALREYYDVTEVIFNEDEPDLYPSGNPVRSLGVPGGGGILAKIQNFYQRVERLRALKRELSCDVAISHLEGADYINLLSKGREKIILLIQGSKVHDGEIKGGVGWLRKKLLMPLLYQRADKVVAVSRDIIPEMIAAFGVPEVKLLAINNSFEVEKVRQRSLEPLEPVMQAIYAAAPVLVTSGRLAIQKNQAPLLDIFAMLLKRRLAKLVFIGDGELRQELVQHAQQLGLRVYQAWQVDQEITSDFDVYFVGLQSNPFKYIRPAQMFVFPSAWEGFPLALGEAMTCGVACVTTDCPTGPREMLAPQSAAPAQPIQQAEWTEYGVLMPMLNNPVTLAASQIIWTDTISQLLENEQQRVQLGAQAYGRALDFSHANTFRRWQQLINQILASKD
jgi:glycosyltransferase involved in cell wall biosynthesis